jgi:hypothetical protein
MSHSLRFDPTGRIDCFYTEAIDLREIGKLKVVRATCIEFNSASQEWEVKAAGDGMLLFSHPSRETCLRWERTNLGPA